MPSVSLGFTEGRSVLGCTGHGRLCRPPLIRWTCFARDRGRYGRSEKCDPRNKAESPLMISSAPVPVMQINLEGRVRNVSLPRKQGLRPVFEAIANAIDAIEEKNAEGTVEIRILRNLSQQTMIEEDPGQHPIYGFEITDTGVGFTEKNWKAFQESDTTVKATQGGKGIGRLLYLKAFDRAEIASTFEEDGKWFRRDFSFSLPTGIVDYQLTGVSPSKQQRLCGSPDSTKDTGRKRQKPGRRSRRESSNIVWNVSCSVTAQHSHCTTMRHLTSGSISRSTSQNRDNRSNLR